MILKPDQQQERQLGRENFRTALGITRRDFLATAAAGIPAGAFYFGYSTPLGGKPIKAGIIGCGDEGQVLLTETNPSYLEIIAYSDIRPSNRKRAMDGEGNAVRVGFKKKYGPDAAKKIEERSEQGGYHEDYRRLLADPEIELVIIALPLHLHAEASIAAMQAGKHVLCEKLMAKSVTECKEMIRVSREKQRLLAIGHQRHYSVLYDNAVSLLKTGVLGDIRYIRALWHRNNTWPVDPAKPEAGLRDSWKPTVKPEDEQWWASLSEEHRQRYGFKTIEELVRWRLFARTGGGLMAELGSHQLDACSIFIARGLHEGKHSVHPLAVSGIGVKSFYEDDREADDHIFATFEFPGPQHGSAKNKDDVVVVTYSSINTNAIENYGETVYGTKGTLMVELERDVLLFKERDPSAAAAAPPLGTSVTVTTKPGGQPVLDSSPSPGSGSPQAGMAIATGQISRGYREEMEHFAYQVSRLNRGEASYDSLYGELRCNGTVALADAVIAHVANMAMAGNRRIEFREEWFDPNSDAAPETSPDVAKS